ncbi:MAG: hypothetical protein MUF06_23905 [Pirellulaceae bacterium]|nr:hypothetical protein [Pirellulaceae bacterium]
MKLLILALLTIDTFAFALGGRLSAALDAIAWLILLVLFEWEATSRTRSLGAWTIRTLEAVRALAIVGVAVAAVAFLEEGIWLDVANSALWISVVVLLEIEVRFPLMVMLSRPLFTGLAYTLYGGLGLLVLVWAWRGEWLDAYDALIWLIAFAIIEMDMLKLADRSAPTPGTEQRMVRPRIIDKL